jgi:cytochrome c oxidase subunit 2
MGQKQDVVPGVTTEIVITPTRTGRFTLICTELCGLGHSTMRAPVRVLQQADFVAWLEQQAQAEPGAGAGEGEGEGSGGSVQELGATTFAQAGCGGCHALAKAGTDAQIGPALDDLTAAANEAGVPVPEFVRSSIVDPDAVITPDYQPGVMPKDFAQSLSPEELDALVAYLSGEASE